VHAYSVDPVVAGDDIDEAEVSGLLGLKASVFLWKGEQLFPEQKRRHTSKLAGRHSAVRGEPERQSLGEGPSIFDRQAAIPLDVLKNPSQRYSLDVHCGHFESGFGGGPSVSPQTLPGTRVWG
jgi:hypothetical protein